MGLDTNVGQRYSILSGGVFLFNLIVGIGAVTMPSGFMAAGVGFSSMILLGIAFLSFMTATWVVESLAISNALSSLSRPSAAAHLQADEPLLPVGESGSDSDANVELSDSSPLLAADNPLAATRVLPPRPGYQQNPLARYSSAWGWWYVPTGHERRFHIRQRFEFGTMSELFFGPWMQRFFYFVLALYLFGDLAIYAVSVPQSLATVTGGWAGISQSDVYYIYLAIFAGLALPFCFLDFQKTSIYQITTAIFRNLTIVIMIVLAFIFVGSGQGADPAEKRHLTSLIFGVMSFIWCLYNILDYSAIFAFSQQTNYNCTPQAKSWACAIQGLYPLNFSNYPVRWLGTFVALYPVFTVSGNYILISITLRNNLMQLFIDVGPFHEGSSWPRLYRHQRLFWSAIAAIPAFIVAFATRQAKVLVNITGAYAGLFIMLVFPAMFVLKGRLILLEHPELASTWNCHQSPFQHRIWAYIVLALAALLFLYTLANDIVGLAT